MAAFVPGRIADDVNGDPVPFVLAATPSQLQVGVIYDYVGVWWVQPTGVTTMKAGRVTGVGKSSS